jgi:CDP-paratose 2-epimerase
MNVKTLLVTGSSGLIGSEVVEHFSQEDWTVHGVDNNMWDDFFGPGGDTRWNTQRLKEQCPTFQHHELDIRDSAGVLALLKELRPNAIVHTATQPSPDLAASRPFDNFDLNAVGTLNLLEAARQSCPEAAFVHMSAIMRCPKRNCAH